MGVGWRQILRSGLSALMSYDEGPRFFALKSKKKDDIADTAAEVEGEKNMTSVACFEWMTGKGK